MISYKDCEYSLFISYAHYDDSSEYGWVTSLRDAIFQRLDKLDADIPKLGLHLSQENGPSAGHLGSELRHRVAKSFGMLLVIGKKYVTSQWCEKELSFFRQHFGDDGTESRLYIAVMSEEAIKEAQKGEHWKQLMPEDQLWVPMFQEIDRNRPLRDRMIDGSAGFPPMFRDRASQIADRLIAEIEKNYAASSETANHAGAPHPSGGATSFDPTGPRRQVLIGPPTVSLVSKIEALETALQRAGADVTKIDRGDIETFDPDDGENLRTKLARADVLVVPLAPERPFQPLTTGGHAAILKGQWAAAGKAERDLIWFKPADVVIDSEHTATEKHAKYFEQLAPSCSSETALINHLFGIGASTTIRVLLENHPSEPDIKPLADQLEKVWNDLPRDDSRPMLRFVALDLDDLETAPQDVTGAVLLLPVPEKPAKSLLDQMKQVENCVPKRGSIYPGCIAVLYNPPLTLHIPKHEWVYYVRVKKSADEPRLVIEEESKRVLERFLLDLLERHRRSTPPGQNGS